MHDDAEGPAGDDPVADTRRWLQRAVIGLNLCPFAKAVHVRNQVRYVLSDAATPTDLLADLTRELEFLQAADPAMVETTLLIHPRVLGDFLDEADAAVEALGLEGELQVASFHPDYMFADSDPDDPANCTNRSPYPMLHLLREESVSRAVDAHPDVDAIVERNIETLERIGVEGFRRLLDG